MSIFENKDLVAKRLYQRLPMQGEADENLLLIGQTDALVAGIIPAAQLIVAYDLGQDTFQKVSHGYKNGNSVWFVRKDSDVVLPTGIVEKKKYYLHVVDGDNFSVHPAYEDAIQNINKIDITAAGTGDFSVEILINEPNDFGEGAIANILQWVSELSREAIKQIDISYRGTQRIIPLDFVLKKYFGSSREYGETDEDYFDRTRDNLFKYPQVSLPSIDNAMKRYSPNVSTISGNDNIFYCDRTTLDNYRIYSSLPQISPAILGSNAGLPFYFITIVDGIDAADVPKVLNFIKSSVTAGVTYTIIFLNVRN